MWLCPDVTSGFESIQMTRPKRHENWLKSKYGQKVELWECSITLKSQNGNSTGQFLKDKNTNFAYTYVKMKNVLGTEVIERHPERYLVLKDPSEYNGELGKPEIFSTRHWKQRDEVNVVNGIAEKADGTFLEQGCQFSKLEEGNVSLNIIVGSYPALESEVEKIVKQSRSTVIMSLLTDQEITQRGIDEQKLKQLYIKKGIK